MRAGKLRFLAILCLLPAAAWAQDFGYSTTVDIYLDMSPAEGPDHLATARDTNDIRFDFTSAVNRPDDDDDGACDHRRDFVFNCGFYDSLDTTGPGAGTDRWVCSAGNNAFRSSSFPKNPGHDPVALTTEGWHTFKHTFRDDGTGILAVDLEIFDPTGALVKSWTLSDPTDVVDVTVGGNRYGWFPQNELAVLAFDATSRTSCLSTEFEQGFETDTAGWDVFGGNCDPVRVSSGTNGIASSEGGWHAEANATGCHAAGDWGGYTCELQAGTIRADLRPGSDHNHVNTRSRQLVPVAFLGSPCFAACEEIDPGSVDFRGASPSLKQECTDEDGDGILDLVLYFRARGIEDPSPAECDDPNATAEITGSSFEGTSFTATVDVTWQGPDCN